MKKLFLVPLMALMTCVSVYAVEVNDLAGLQTALAAGGEITLTADINAGSTQLTVAKGVTIKGGGYCIKGTDTYVFIVATSDAVVMENLVIYAAKTSKAGRGIRLGNEGAPANNANLALSNVTINATYRAMDVWYSDGVTLNINDCVFQNVQGQVVDAKGNPTAAKYDIELTSANAGDTRGLNFGQLTNSTITITNTTMQGFFYVLNNVTGSNGNMSGTKLAATNCTFKGRCALNVWGYGADYTFTDCHVTGINNYGGSQEGFSCFVFNNQNTCHDNTLTINGGTTVAAVFNETGSANPNANQFLVDDRATNNTIVINNSSYTCTKDLGIQKGGVVYGAGEGSSITINGGTYDCPEIVGPSTDAGSSIVINEGEFDVIVTTETAYYPNTDKYKTNFENTTGAIEVNGGTFINAAGEDINALAYAEDPTVDPVSIVTTPHETYENQDGSTTVVPVGTNDETKQVDPAIKTDLVWGTDVVLTAKNVKLLPTQTLTLATGVATADRVDMGQDTKIIVKDGTILTIGEGGVALNNDGEKDPQIVVEAGGKLITHGQMYGSVTGNILIETSETKQGVLLFDPDMNTYGANHPNGVVELSSKGHHSTSPSKYIWQRFGIPTFDGNTTIRWDGTKTWIYEYEYGETDNWVKMYEGTAGVLPVADKIPFQCYNMTSEAAAAGKKYTFEGALMGNQDYDLGFVHGWNYFANSYTAPIQVRALLDDVKAKYGSNISATAYIYRSEDGWWDEVSIGRFELHEYFKNLLGEEYANENYPIAQTQINPMQAFVLYLFSGSAANGEISYKDNVYDPAIAAGAPRRRAAAANTSIEAAVLMSVSDGVTKDVATLIEGADFSEEFDNGYDAFKMINPASFNIYAIGVENKYGAIATNNLVGTQIAFDALTTGEYTLTFTGVIEADYAIKDLMTNEVVNIEAGKSYTFRANAGATGARFSIVKPAKLPTAISNTTATSKQTGVYSITGMYLGEKAVLSTLPKGVYVVDGKKVVK